MLLEALAVQAIVTVALVPLTLAAFGSVSLIGPLVNLARDSRDELDPRAHHPACRRARARSSIASDAVLHVAAWLHEQGWPWLAAAADLPWALIHASPPLWWYAIAAREPLPQPHALAAAHCDSRPSSGWFRSPRPSSRRRTRAVSTVHDARCRARAPRSSCRPHGTF